MQSPAAKTLWDVRGARRGRDDVAARIEAQAELSDDAARRRSREPHRQQREVAWKDTSNSVPWISRMAPPRELGARMVAIFATRLPEASATNAFVTSGDVALAASS